MTSNNPKLDDILQNLAKDIPEEEFKSFEHLFVYIEEAFWVYHDIYRAKTPSLPSLSLKQFSGLQDSPSLQPFYHGLINVTDFDQVLSSFTLYKNHLPRFGACILNSSLDKVVLVKDRGGWGFPRGKGKEGESEETNAIREVNEEMGLDISDKLKSTEFIEHNFHGQFFKLFIIVDVPETTQFAIQTRHEIKEVSWHTINLIPQYRHQAAKAFFMTIPFINKLKAWIAKSKRSAPKRKLSELTTDSTNNPKPNNLKPNNPKPNTPKPIIEIPTTVTTTASLPPATVSPQKTLSSSTQPNSVPSSPLPTPNPPTTIELPLKKRKQDITKIITKPETTIPYSPKILPTNNLAINNSEATKDVLHTSSVPTHRMLIDKTTNNSNSTNPSPYLASPTKPPKSWFIEWCNSHKVNAIFQRHEKTVNSYGIYEFTVSLVIPEPFNITFESGTPKKNVKDAENAACLAALEHLPPISPPAPPAKINTTGHPVSILQEVCQKNKWATPVYETVQITGPPNMRLFVVEVTIVPGKFRSDRGYSTIKLARENAASAALEHI